ncbi:MAG: GNAT family N-acetyltransferase [Gammaproteobacteria bacterium]|nr:GNAT family N-acetyltransferase [Gammaproteobacteria bacterium]
MNDIIIRDLQASDATNLVSLFQRCYGRTYGSRVFYDTQALQALIRAGKLRSVVASDDTTLLGHTGITIRHPDSLVCETGNTVVDPAFRGRGLLKQLGGALRERVLREGFIGYMHYPTTAHEIMQRSSVTGGGRETGVMLAYIADTTEYKALQQRVGRLAATVVYQPFAPAPPRDVLCPARYHRLLEQIYGYLDLPRVLRQASSSSSSPPGGEIASANHAERGLLSMTVTGSCEDVGERVSRLVKQHKPKIAHVDLPLDDLSVDRTVNELVDRGFFFCAVLPEFAHTDVLRLQMLDQPTPEDFQPELVNEQAQRLCEFMLQEVDGSS